MEIDGTRCPGIQPGIEKSFRVIQGRAHEKIKFDVILENTACANQSLMRPDGGIPLPFLGQQGRLKDQPAQTARQFER